MKRNEGNESLGLPTLDPSQRLLTTEDLKRLIDRRAQYMGVDYHSEDIVSVEDNGCVYVFLKRCNMRYREIEIDGFPTVGVNDAGDPIIDWDYPIYVAYHDYFIQQYIGPTPSMSLPFQGHVVVAIPELVIALMPDGTIKDGYSHQTVDLLEAQREIRYREMLESAQRSIKEQIMRRPYGW